MNSFNKVLENIFETKTTFDQDGNTKKVTGGVSRAEASLMIDIIKGIRARTTLETGVAFGVSTLAICQAHKMYTDGIHYGIDPCQYNEHNGVAINALKSAQIDKYFKLLEGPSHLMIPKLISDKLEIDFAFIDGWHTFDYTLLDFFLIDKLLKVGGFLAMHDLNLPSKRKVLGYILTHRKYKVSKRFYVQRDRSLFYLLLRAFKNIIKYPRNIYSKYFWKIYLTSMSNMIVLEKCENYEPPYYFYKNF